MGKKQKRIFFFSFSNLHSKSEQLCFNTIMRYALSEGPHLVYFLKNFLSVAKSGKCIFLLIAFLEPTDITYHVKILHYNCFLWYKY